MSSAPASAAPARFHRLTPDEATGKAADLLGELVARHGEVGDMVATMAHSPAVLAGYLELSRAMKRAKLARDLSERISIAVQTGLGCRTCLDAHIDAAHHIGITDGEIAAAQDATSADPRTAALLRFSAKVAAGPAAVDEADIEELRARRYSDREILDVVGIVALNQLTGTFNLIAGLSRADDTEGSEVA